MTYVSYLSTALIIALTLACKAGSPRATSAVLNDATAPSADEPCLTTGADLAGCTFVGDSRTLEFLELNEGYEQGPTTKTLFAYQWDLDQLIILYAVGGIDLRLSSNGLTSSVGEVFKLIRSSPGGEEQAPPEADGADAPSPNDERAAAEATEAAAAKARMIFAKGEEIARSIITHLGPVCVNRIRTKPNTYNESSMKYCHSFAKSANMNGYENVPLMVRACLEMLTYYCETGSTLRMHSWDGHQE